MQSGCTEGLRGTVRCDAKNGRAWTTGDERLPYRGGNFSAGTIAIDADNSAGADLRSASGRRLADIASRRPRTCRGNDNSCFMPAPGWEEGRKLLLHGRPYRRHERASGRSRRHVCRHLSCAAGQERGRSAQYGLEVQIGCLQINDVRAVYSPQGASSGSADSATWISWAKRLHFQRQNR